MTYQTYGLCPVAYHFYNYVDELTISWVPINGIKEFKKIQKLILVNKYSYF